VCRGHAEIRGRRGKLAALGFDLTLQFRQLLHEIVLSPEHALLLALVVQDLETDTDIDIGITAMHGKWREIDEDNYVLKIFR
jgi:hypothetical protein